VPLPTEFADALRAAVGDDYVRTDAASLTSYGVDALKRGHDADVVVLPDGADQVSAILKLCSAHLVPIVPRGGGTGYTGGAVPLRGGVVLSLERMNRILEIDEQNLVAVVEPNAITGTIQDAVERVGLFYPPDPASLRTSVIGGMITATVLAIFYIPLFFVLVRRGVRDGLVYLRERRRRRSEAAV